MDTNTLISKINKEFGEGSIGLAKTLGFLDVPRLSSGSPFMDWALGQSKSTGTSGWPMGRIIELYGPESAGKSLISLKTVAHAQRKGMVCAYFDCEGSFDKSFAATLGVDIKSLILSRESAGEKVIDMVCEMLKSEQVDVVVFDSLAAMIPKMEIDDPMEQMQMAPVARMMSKACVAEDEETFLPETGELRKIKDIGIGNVLYSVKDNLLIKQKVIDKRFNGEKEVWEINGDIKLTSDHLVLTVVGYVPVNKLKIGDVLVMRGSLNKFGDKEIDIRLSKIVGYLLGDGSISGKWGVGSFTNKDDEIVDEFNKLVGYFGCNLKKKLLKDIDYFIVKKRKFPKGSFKNPLREELDRVGLKRSRSYDKIIPSIFFQANKKTIISLIEGLFNSDGYISKQGCIGFVSASRLMCFQVKELLGKFGIFGSIAQRKSQSNFGKYWTFRITGISNIKLFLDNFLLTKRKQECLEGILKRRKYDATSEKDWLPSYFIPLIKKSFPKGKRVSRILGSKRRTYPEWNKPERVKLSRVHIQKLVKHYSGHKQSSKIMDLMRDDLQYKIVKSIKRKGLSKVYDLTMEKTPNFAVGDYIVHNCRKLTFLNKRTLLIFINQLRVNPGCRYGNPEYTPGGRALKFYASIRLDVRRGDWIFDVDDKKKKVGQVVKFRVVKNKSAPPLREGYFKFLYTGEFDRVDELISLGLLNKVITRKGAYFYLGKHQFQGRENMEAEMKKDVKLFEEARKEVFK